jgi:hypothetical protein
MSEPRIGYDTILTVTNVTASAEETGFPATALANPLTYDRWRAPVLGDSSGLTYIYIDAGSAVTLDYLGIASHNLGTIGAALTLYGNSVAGLTGSPVTLAVVSSIATDAPFIESFTAGAYRYYTIAINPGAVTVTESIDIGVLFLGAAMQFERCIMGQHAPINYNRKTEFNINISDNGQFLGRSITRQGYETSVSFNMITGAWGRATFQPFVKYARTKPYFWQWNPTTYPSEVAYVHTDGDIGIQYTGDRTLMSANWTMKGLGWDE